MGHGTFGTLGTKTCFSEWHTLLSVVSVQAIQATFGASDAVLSIQAIEHFTETLIVAIALNAHGFHNVLNAHRAMFFCENGDDLVLL